MATIDKLTTKRPRKTIGSVGKALNVLDVLAREDDLSLSELAARLRIPKSSLYHLLATLESDPLARVARQWRASIQALTRGLL